MKLEIPTLKQLTERVLSNFSRTAQLAAVGDETVRQQALRRDNDRFQAFAISAAIYGLYQYARDFLAKQANPLTATGSYLTLWARVYDVPQKRAVPAAGFIRAVGLPGTALSSGLEFRRGDIRYRLEASGVVEASGSVLLAASAVAVGASGNAEHGELLAQVTPVAGIAAVEIDEMSGGADDEEEEDWRARIIKRIQNPPHGGAPADYELWALEVPGVAQAWCTRTPQGAGTVGLSFMLDTGFPVLADANRVRAHIEDRTRGPAADDLIIDLLTARTVNVTLTDVLPATPDVYDAIKLSLQELFHRVRKPGAAFPLSHLREAISIAAGEHDHVLTAPTSIPTPDADEILTLGTVTINGVVV